MDINFMELKPREIPKDFTINVYPRDYEKFKRFVAFLNLELKAEDGILKEDVFQKIMTLVDNVEGFKDFEWKAKKHKKRKEVVQ